MAKRARAASNIKRKSGISTTEILIAIITVIVIFSLIGILNIRPAAEKMSEGLEVAMPDSSAAESSGAAAPSPQTTEIVVQPGTVLSASDMEFEVVPEK